MQENCHIRFFIFELWSQRFFDLKLAIFRLFENSKKRIFWRNWPPNCGPLLNTSIKVNRWKKLLVPCISKLILWISFRWNLRFGVILSDCFDHILISEKIDIFDENCEKGRFCFSHISMKTESKIKVWGYLSDRLRRWVGKQTKKSYLRGQFRCAKSSF